MDADYIPAKKGSKKTLGKHSSKLSQALTKKKPVFNPGTFPNVNLFEGKYCAKLLHLISLYTKASFQSVEFSAPAEFYTIKTHTTINLVQLQSDIFSCRPRNFGLLGKFH